MDSMKAIATTQTMGFPELRGSLQTLKYPAFAEIKLDGELAWHIWDDTLSVLVGKNGKVTTDFIVDGAKAGEQRHGITIGELYAADGKFGDLYKRSDPKFMPLRYRPFDIIQLDGVDWRDKPLIERKEMLHTIFPNLAYPKLVENEAEALQAAKFIMSQGFEGVVLKNLEERYRIGPCAWVKVKTKDENVYTVQNIDPVQERIEVSVTTMHGTKLVGVKCLNRDKATLKLGDFVKIEHQGVLALGGLRHPVYKGKV